jgi:uncharacterized Zn finger protein (UPF0148 family)
MSVSVRVKMMEYCPKCGTKVTEEMTFCPKCGASLKAAPTPSEARPTTHRRDEKAEKSEKSEKHEKREKHEKGEYGFIGPLVGGLILIFIGLALYVRVALPNVKSEFVTAFFFILIGIAVIVLAIYAVVLAGRRHPKT